ncbi:hypothetical protein U14_02003 [Candidatus Moduliflexus flocculans]|uniref:Uncharacterized protein n=1 Tax=Candidatus Moduliflexus flocculans TaxID=1499966 RepID=A0A0S6VTA6_9BACT|nr:hypothetical protein U14_02003 [Candidatus Moduliflexus flocculans]
MTSVRAAPPLISLAEQALAAAFLSLAHPSRLFMVGRS